MRKTRQQIWNSTFVGSIRHCVIPFARIARDPESPISRCQFYQIHFGVSGSFRNRIPQDTKQYYWQMPANPI